MHAASRKTLLLAFVLLSAAALVYWPGLSGRFLFDDFPNIVSNPLVHLEAWSWSGLASAAQAYEHGAYGRPLATISFALNYLIGGSDPFGYKVGGLIVHLINSALVFLLVRKLFRLVSTEAWTTATAFTVALLWAVHPLQVSSVLYVVQRMETLSLTFVLAALLAYLQGRCAQIKGEAGWPWLLCCIPLVVLGLLSKETAILFPAFALSLELTVLDFKAQSGRTSRSWKWAYGCGVALAVVLFATVILPPYLEPSMFEFRGFTLSERLLTQLRVLPLYLGQMLLPLSGSLTFYYDTFPISHGWLDPVTTLLGGLLLLALLGTAFALRRRAPLVSLGIFWFFSCHLLTSNVFPLEMVFEHRNYFALLGVLLALADLVRRIPMRDGPRLKYAAVAAIVLTMAGLTLLRSATWGNSLHLAMDLSAKNPMSARASNDLAEQYMLMAGGSSNSPFYSMAVQEFERGARLPNASPLPEQGLILFAASLGKPAQQDWWDRLYHKLRTRPLGPQEESAVAGLLKHRYQGIDLDDRKLAQAYIILTDRTKVPNYVYAQFGDHAIKYLHDDALADRMFLAAINRNPHDADYAMQTFATLVADGHKRQAQVVMERAKALGLAPEGKVAGVPGPAASGSR